MSFEHHRQDYRHKPVRTLLEFIRRIAEECRIPLTFGGNVRSLDDIRERILNGADKVSVNTLLHDAPEVVRQAAHAFGSQAIVASIDFRIVDNAALVFRDHGKVDVGVAPAELARQAREMGAGEILLNAIDRDGMARGYDLDAIDAVVRAVDIPVIACGGAGRIQHFLECFERTKVQAVAAGNIFHFTENAYPRAKKFLAERRDDVRPPLAKAA